MSPLVSSIEIARTPAEVFSYVTDPTRFAEWQKDVVKVRVGEGSFTTTRQIGRSERTMTQEITESDPPARWVVRGIDGPIRPGMTQLHANRPVNGGG